MSDTRLTFDGRMRSFRCAANGVRITVCSQQNAWIHAFATVVVAICGVGCGLTATEWCLIILAAIAVWTAETLNTALEFLTDLASPEFHPLAARAKDVAAGAVLIAAGGAALIGIFVFAPYLAAYFNSFR